MTDARDRELEDEARALLHPAREPLAAPAEVKARALRRLTLALPILGGGAGDGGGETGGGETGGGETGGGEPFGPTGGAGGATPAAAKGLGGALAARVPAWSLLVSFVAGGAIAAMATRPAPSAGARHEASVEGVDAPRPSASAAPAAAPPSSSSIVAVAPVESAPAPATLPVASAASSASSARVASSIAPTRAGSDGALEAERALLDVARTALGRGDGGNALRATEEHGRKFPRGILAEEREAMTIQALRLLHRDDEARARLSRFRGRFPTSLIRPALEATDGGPP